LIYVRGSENLRENLSSLLPWLLALMMGAVRRAGGVSSGRTRGSEASTFVLEKIAYSGGRSEFGLAQPRAAGHFCFRKMGAIERATFVMRKIAYGVGERKNGQAPLRSARPF
jgi:hypothetical protein